MKRAMGDIDASIAALPTGKSWCSVQDLLHDAMRDLHRSWVQEHLLRPQPHLGSSLFFSDSKLSESISAIYSEGLQSMAVLSVPAFTIDDMSAGVEVFGDQAGLVSTTGLVPSKFMFSHFVENKRTGTRCSVAVDGHPEFVEMMFCSLFAKGFTTSLRFRFQRHMFFGAFRPGQIDFSMLKKGLQELTIIPVQRSAQLCGCRQMHCIDCLGEKSSLLKSGGSKEGFEHDEFHECKVHGIVSRFKRSSLISLHSTFSRLSKRMIECGKRQLRPLVYWGLCDRLRRVGTVVPAPLSDGDLGLSFMPPSIEEAEDSCARERNSTKAQNRNKELESIDCIDVAHNKGQFLSDVDMVCLGSLPELL